jgi:hypothetical protein
MVIIRSKKAELKDLKMCRLARKGVESCGQGRRVWLLKRLVPLKRNQALHTEATGKIP